nr:MAG TPA: hypothetical protein [Caudoviricetes sp.]
MKNLKYLAYAVPCCMALSGAGDGVFLAALTTIVLSFMLD